MKYDPLCRKARKDNQTGVRSCWKKSKIACERTQHNSLKPWNPKELPFRHYTVMDGTSWTTQLRSAQSSERLSTADTSEVCVLYRDGSGTTSETMSNMSGIADPVYPMVIFGDIPVGRVSKACGREVACDRIQDAGFQDDR